MPAKSDNDKKKAVPISRKKNVKGNKKIKTGSRKNLQTDKGAAEKKDRTDSELKKKLKERKNRDIALLEERSKLFDFVLEASNDGIWYVNLVTGEKYFPKKWAESVDLHYSKGLSLGDGWGSLIHPDDKDRTQKEMQDLRNGEIADFDHSYRVCDKNGNYKWFRSRGISILDEKGKPYILAGINSDIDYLKRQEEQLEFLAYHDSLTSLPNRALLLDRLDIAVKIAKRENVKAAVLFIDIDNFKRYNDSMGHKAGDNILLKVSFRISELIREYDTLARFGGDEFAVIFQQVSTNDEISMLAKRILNCFEEPFQINQSSIYLSSTIGISVFPDDGTSPEELLKHSDMAMYNAKAKGKNQIQYFNFSMNEEILKKLALEKEFRKAILNNELHLHYQPQYNLKTGTIRGFEALIRWESPVLGNVTPLEFIPMAEETGLIIPIGEFVLRNACHDASEWIKTHSFDGVMSVNISAVQLRNADIVKTVKDILAETGLDPKILELEITESILIDSFDSAISMLTELKSLGIRISLDDFGTGYSSLSYLKHLPINTLKIDKSFINEIIPGSSERKMTGSIISLVSNLEMETIAEGVETIEQLEYLKEAGCGSIQGFLLSKPVSADDIREIINRSTNGIGFNGVIE